MISEFKFKPDPDGIEAVSSSGPVVAAALTDAAERAAGKMRTMSNGLDDDDYFEFKGSIKSIPAADDVRTIAVGSQTSVAYAGSDSPGWHLQEFGTRNQRPRAIIRRAMRAVTGIEFKEGTA